VKSASPPTSTYRLQLMGHLRFEEVRGLVSYLADLGVGALYLSPFLRSKLNSTHGYDIVDHGQVDPALGTDDDFLALANEVKASGMGLVIDIVPNHMCIDDTHNGWWQDLLENGPCSPYANYFDVDWNPPKAALHGKILLAVLGDQFGRILEDQQLQLVYQDQRFMIRYAERHFPTDPRSWVAVLKLTLEAVAVSLEPGQPQRLELESVITALEHLPERSNLATEAIQERYREKEVARRRLGVLLQGSPVVREALAGSLNSFNGTRGMPESFDRLETFLNEQAYRLCYWRVATDEINYRRFFDVDTLAAIRVEDPDVFRATHALALRFVSEGFVTGLRIDHADGLLDPQNYLATLAESANEAVGAAAPSPYLLVEKILSRDEKLPRDWPVQGTTGYNFLNVLNGLFVDRDGWYALRNTYQSFTGEFATFPRVLYDAKHAILSTSLSSELYVLSDQLVRIAEQHRWSRDFTRASLFRSLREVVACFPVYRTYIRPGSDEVTAEDRKRIRETVRVAKRRNPAVSPSYFDFIASVLLLDDPDGLSELCRAQRRQFVLKFQQVTGPITAKGMEDTAFYRYYPLASLNEVGGDPMYPIVSVERFHDNQRERVADWPHEMSATGTHDTKRGEDLRARLNVLSEIPDAWAAAIARWRQLNAQSRPAVDDEQVADGQSPDANEEYLIYQTLVGIWPIAPTAAKTDLNEAVADDDAAWALLTQRMLNYLEKALREAKLHTSWLAPDREFEDSVQAFVRAILNDRTSPFLIDLDRFARSIADAGFVNSLAQLLVKICAPGVPDFYQGVELWDFNLVDPDNRRPVDFSLRREMLAQLISGSREDQPGVARELLSLWPDERVKLLVTWRGLECRRKDAELFSNGDYQSLTLVGPRQANACAFTRVAGERWAICIVPRLAQAAWTEDVADDSEPRGDRQIDWAPSRWWRQTWLELPVDGPRRFRHAITGQIIKPLEKGATGLTLDLGDLFAAFPVALLTSELE
jgi:(1->4)-alpha-D-glucan 1-alpha-D-glucosylmutase